MPWPSKRLSEIARRIGGGTPSRKEKSYWNGDLPWFTVADLSDVDDIQNLCTSRECITRLALQQSAAKIIPVRAVVFSSRVVIGKVGIATKELATNQDFCSFVTSEEVLPEFLAYFLIHVKHELRSQQRGATIKGVTTEILDSLRIPIFTLERQRQTISRIKECMHRVNEIASLKGSTVDETRQLKTEVVSFTVKQLASRYACTTIGRLVADAPSAMRSGPFGSAMKHDEFVPQGTLVIGIANVKENRFDPVRKWMIDDVKFNQMKRYQVVPGDLLITIMGTIGRACVVPDDIGSAITSKHVYRIRLPRMDVSPAYVSYLINYDYGIRSQLDLTASGGVMPGLNATKLRNLNVCVPPLAIQQSVVDRWDEIHAALYEAETLHSNSEISDLRASILRNAFSGAR
jgi:type I restriction enzyme, S subunit